MYVKFNDGTQFTVPKGKPVSLTQAVIQNHKRDVLNVTVEGEYSAVKAAFNGQSWSLVDDEGEYDKSIYTLVASICDNMDGTITVRVGREDTVEDKLRDSNKALQKANAEQAEIINILAGGAV